jgi:hypothetical protein
MENLEKQIVRIIENYSPKLAAEEILRLFSVVGRSEQFICYKADLGNSRCSSQCVECGKNECYSK